jgi:Cof subfamily protein (haloacid dehalogenase superfamily)
VIKLIALDLDGTLLGPDSRVHDIDRDAVVAARDRGIQIVLNTSRWYGLAQRTARRLELHTPIIGHCGAQIREPDDGRELYHVRIPAEAARQIAARCDEGGYETYTTVEGITYMRVPWADQIDPERLPRDMRIAPTHAEHITAPATGIIVFSEPGVRAVVDTFGPQYGDTITFMEAVSEATQPYVTIIAKGVDKGRALRLVCEELGIAPEESLAVGDTVHDVPMFDVASIGVAMGNAPAEVQDRADAVAPSNADCGVAWAIRRFVFAD